MKIYCNFAVAIESFQLILLALQMFVLCSNSSNNNKWNSPGNKNTYFNIYLNLKMCYTVFTPF